MSNDIVGSFEERGATAMNHTPGPWEWAEANMDAAKRINGPSGIEVMHVVFTGNADMKISDADAALIAAAPDLLEALKLLLSQADTSDPYEHVTVGKHITRAERAIAKAEGRMA